MAPGNTTRRLFPLLAENAAPAMTLACLFAAALAASCAQSGLNSWAGLTAAIAFAFVVVGALARLLTVLPARPKE